MYYRKEGTHLFSKALANEPMKIETLRMKLNPQTLSTITQRTKISGFHFNPFVGNYVTANLIIVNK